MNGRPRICPVVIDDGLYTHRWLAPLLWDARLEVVGVGCLSPFTARDFNPGRARGFLPVVLRRTRYYGLPAAARFAARAALARAADAAFRLGWGRPHSVATAVRARGLPLLLPPDGDVNHPGFLSELRALAPDLVLGAFSQRAGPKLLALPRRGCLNLHFSLLPRHRGREPLFYAMLAGEGAGVTVHWMTPRLDAGGIVAQQALDARRFVRLHQLILAACAVAAELVPRALLRACETRAAETRERPRDGADPGEPIASWPDAAAVARFARRGLRFV